jgi:hypothetical protein
MQRFMTPEDYIRELEKELVNPESYEFESTYHYCGELSHQRGKISIDKNLKVVGEIEDPNSMCRKHVVKGSVTIDDKFVTLKFEKMPTGFLNNIYYVLVKPKDDKGLIGRYEGKWSFAEEDGVNLGFKPGTLEPVPHPEHGNKADLVLNKL